MRRAADCTPSARRRPPSGKRTAVTRASSIAGTSRRHSRLGRLGRAAEPARACVPRGEPYGFRARGQAAAAREQAPPEPARGGAGCYSWRWPPELWLPANGERHAPRRRPPSRNGSAPRRWWSRAWIDPSSSPGRARASTTPSRPGATYWPRCCEARRRRRASGGEARPGRGAERGREDPRRPWR